MNTYGVQSVPADTTPKILHLLEDRNAEVREAAVMCLETMYIQIGPSFMVNNQSAFIFRHLFFCAFLTRYPQLQNDLQSKSIRAGQLKMLSERFDSLVSATLRFGSPFFDSAPVGAECKPHGSE